jgi:uncharacterized protein with GYD domain
MATYLVLGTFRPEAVAGMIERPGDRAAAVHGLFESVGGRLLSYHWVLGVHDFAIVAEFPDARAGVAAHLAAASSGAFSHIESHQLIEPAEMDGILAQAKRARAAFAPPGR